MRFPSRAFDPSRRRRSRRHSKRPAVGPPELLERRMLLAGDAFSGMLTFPTAGGGAAGASDDSGSGHHEPPTNRVSTTTRVSDDGTRGVTITVSERRDSPDSWTRTETVAGWYDVSDDISDATGTWSTRAWGVFASSYTVSLASGTLHHALVESGTGQVSERVTTAWSGSSSRSSGTVTQTWQFDATTQFMAASSGTTRSGLLTRFSGNESLTGTGTSSWSMAAGIVNGVPGGSSGTTYLETGGETHSLGYSTRSVLDGGGRIVTTGDGFERASGRGATGLTVHAATLQSVTFDGGSAAASNTMHGFENERWDHQSSVTYSLGPQGWTPVAGTASSGSEGSRSRSWSAAANFSVAQPVGTASGTSQVSGSDTVTARYGLTSTVSGGRWVTVGAGAAIGHGGTSQAYRLGGTESSTTSVATSRSSLAAHGNHDSSYGYTIGQHFDDRHGWRTMSGTASASQHGSDHAAWTSTVQNQPWVSWGGAGGPLGTGGSNDQTYAGTLTASVVAPGGWRSYGSGTTTVRSTSRVGLAVSSHGATRSHSFGDAMGWHAAAAAAAPSGDSQAGTGAAPGGSAAAQSWNADWDPDTDSAGRPDPAQTAVVAASTATPPATQATYKAGQHVFGFERLPPGVEHPDPNWTNYDSDAAVFADAVYFIGGFGFDRLGINYTPKDGFAASLFQARDGTFYLTFRGTDGWDDMGSNTRQALGFSASQYQQAIDLARQVRRFLPPEARLILTGHSLGGGLAAAASYGTGLNAITFNASSPNWYYTLFKKPGSIRSHVVISDPLSVGRSALPDGRRLPGLVILHRPRVWNTHSMVNFLLKDKR